MKYIIMFLLIFNSFVFAEPKFLMPEEAFKASAHMKKRCTASATIELGKDIYLYQSKITAKVLEKNSGIEVEHLVLPEGVDHDGEKVYTTSPTFDIPLVKTKEMNEIVPITLVVGYQGCSEQGLCYEPMESKFTFDIETSKLPLKETNETPLKNTPSSEK